MTEEYFSPEVTEVHRVWHKFSNWLANTYGKDLYSDWIYLDPEKKFSKYRYKDFNEYELSKRLVGYEVINRVERYVKRYCPKIKIVNCDDELHASSIILLIPHPKFGVTVMFIPQCTGIQNQFFLYPQHLDSLVSALNEFKDVIKHRDE